MQIILLRIPNKKKTIFFLGIFFIFLFLGLEISAQEHCKLPTDSQPWNKAGSCIVDITYTDPGDGSGLAECLYATDSGVEPTCPTDGTWLSACECNGLIATTCSVPITIGSETTYDCYIEGENTCKICSKAVDTARNEGYCYDPVPEECLYLNIDYTSPSAQIISPDAGSCQKENFDSTFRFSDTGGSKLSSCEYKIVSSGVITLDWISAGSCSGLDSVDLTKNITVGPAGYCQHEGTNICTVYVKAEDRAGNVSAESSRSFSIDWSEPYLVNWDPTSRDWSNTDVSVTVQYADDGCGMDNVKYCWTTGVSCTPDTLFPNTWGGNTTQPLNGSWTLCITATDIAGNTVSDCKGPYKIDKEAPITEIQCNGADCTTNWYNADLSITLNCTDYPTEVSNSGCDVTYYCRDTTDTCSPTNPYSGSFTPIAEGISYIRFFSRDVAGNIEAIQRKQIKWDKTPPTAGVDGAPTDWVNTDLTAAVTCSDGESGCDSTSYAYQVFSSNPGTCPSTGYTSGSLVTIASHSWVCSYVEDIAGNSDFSDPVEFKIDKTIPTAQIISPTSGSWQTPTGFNSVFRYSDNGGSGLNVCQYRVVSGGVETVPWTLAGSCSGSGPIDLTKNISVGPTADCRNSGANTCTVYVKSQDVATNWSNVNSRSFSIDLAAPNCSISLSTSKVNVGQFFTIDVSGSSDDVGIYQVRFSSDDSQDGNPTGSWTQWYDWNVSSGDWDATNKTKSWSFSTAGDKEVWVQLKDQAGQTSQCSQNIHANYPPTCSGLSASPISGYLPLSVIFTGSGNDSDGSIVSYQWDFDGDGDWDQTTSENTTGYTYNSPGTYCAKLRVQDNDGVWSTNTGSCPGGTCTQEITVNEDTTGPTVLVAGAPTNWQNSDASASVSCSDPETGCDETSYRLKIYLTNPGSCSTNYSDYNLTSPQTISSHQWVCATAKDNKGNVGFSSDAEEFKIDKINPSVSVFDVTPTILSIANPSATISWQVSDSGDSHLSHVEVWRTVDAGGTPDDTQWQQIGSNYNAPADSDNWSSSATDSPSDGTYWYGIHVLDRAGNMETESAPIKVQVDKTKPTATIYRWDGSNWVVDTGDSWQNSDFTRRSYDSDTGFGLDKCYYYVYDNIAGESTTGILERNCSTLTWDINISVGSGKNCPSQERNACSLYVYAVDKAGNESDHTLATYHIDYTPPVVGETSPTAALEGISEIFSATVADNLELNYCWLYVDGENKESMTISPSPCQNGAPCTATTSYTFSSGGTHTMYAMCADQYDSQGGSYLNFASGNPVNVDVTANNLPEITGGPSATTTPPTGGAPGIDYCTTFTNQSGCLIYFNVTATDTDGDNLTYSWIFGDGESSNEQNPSHYYATATTYSAIVTVSDNRGGAVSSGLNLAVEVPTLSVELGANPSTGVDSLSNVDLTATTSGTMFGTINYKFDCQLENSDCTADGDYSDCDFQADTQTTESYTATDLCDYPSIGTYTPKTLIQRGTGSTQATTTVSVVVNQPPICQIDVPEFGVTNTAITIGMGGSSDTEGAMSGVKFSSDNNLNSLADGSWDPASGYYDWNISSGSWDATNKTMKWSFADPGVYEVWAEVKDNVNQTDACFATTTITECLPGDTKTCTSPQGCEHTLTCQADGTWPACPSDECTPGDAQDCGVNGTQICTDSCSWGVCVESGDCTEPSPTCDLCYHPVCVDSVWECQPDPAGTDCGDCRECREYNGERSCNYICPEICIEDSCVSCSDYYDGGCGYGYCGILEKPVWSYSGETCQYDCQYDASCEEETSSPSPEEPCERNYPQVTLSPSSQSGTAGQTLTYTVSVINNDSLNCDASTFSLESFCPPEWTCSLNSSSLTISPGQSDSTILRVTSPLPPPCVTATNYEVSVKATNNTVPDYSSIGYAVYQIYNNPPSAINLSVDSPNSTDYCFISGYPPVRVRWQFDDCDLPLDSQTAYEVEVYQSGVKVADTGKQLSSNQSYLFTSLSFGVTYSWRVMVWDENNTPSDWVWGSNFTTISHPYPWPDFEWFPQKPTAGEEIQFCSMKEGECSEMSDERKTILYNGEGTWQWNFNADSIIDSNLKNPTYSYPEENPAGYTVSLKVTDGSGYGPCEVSYNISVRKPLPEWQEVPPF